MTKSKFRRDLVRTRADLEQHQKENERKRALALRLRALRKKRDLSQSDVSVSSGLQQSVISRLEAPSGPMPTFDTIERYVSACGGYAAVVISDRAFEKETQDLTV